ncbi:hypothetical protein ACSQ67_023300 [Phaseolus vulgaris]
MSKGQTLNMDKPPLGKHFDNLRFVFLISFVFCFSLLLLDYYAAVSDHGIDFLLFHMNGANHEHMQTMPEPSDSSFIFNETADCPEKTIHANQNNVSTVPGEVLKRDNVGVVANSPSRNLDSCAGQYIYVHGLASRFNEDLVKGCHSLMRWFDMCPYMSNLGLGPKVIEKSKEKVLLKENWYATNQFSLEVIFHNTMKNYKCLTKDSSLASAIYVPYYAGLDVGQYLWGDSMFQQEMLHQKS